MKKLIILGASQSQVPLIRAAKRLGVETRVLSTPGSWPGFAEADSFSHADISDPEAVLEEARAFGADGIATCCMDTGVLSIGKVCSQMKLKGPSWEAVGLARNKYRMKEAFVKAGVRTADFCLVHNEEELEKAVEKLSLPLAVKAVDLMGSRGIYRCDTPESARSAFREAVLASGEDYVVVEQFLEGTLFDAEAMIENGKMVYCMLDNSDLIECSVPTSIGHSIPFLMEEEAGEDARQQVEKAVRSLGLDNTAVDLDLMYCGGKVYVIEINPRAGASCLPLIVGCRYGIDYYEALVRLALGEETASMFSHPDESRACLARMLDAKKDGRIARIKLPSLPERGGAPARVEDFSLDVKEGDAVRKYTNGRDRIGQVVISGQSLKACSMLMDEILSGLELDIQ